ncbi:MAG: type I glyceraldehyde-3-phosphate dehydrogenase [Alphaproteobacteria bacterium]|nr:type I glyceraldehyde-3-phosphate dehydrogenase [Alphaproteobacteria bacterium]
MRVAINGLGRIGRLVLRAVFEQYRNDVEVVAVNDLMDIDTFLHLFKYDSVHGKFSCAVKKTATNRFSINDHEIEYLSQGDLKDLHWSKFDVDLVMECSGKFKDRKDCSAHINNGAKKVLLSCPGKDFDKTIIFGVNNDQLTKEDIFVSNGSCTTNCLATVVKVIHSEFGIASGTVSTIHSYTRDQYLVDSFHKDLRRARAGAINIIPTNTGSAVAIGDIFPELKGKLLCQAFRVPIENVSLIDCCFSVEKDITELAAKNAIINWADFKIGNGVLQYTEEELVSSDFNHSACSACVDLPLLKVINSNCLKIIAWYDNEWGFANRMLDNACLMFR